MTTISSDSAFDVTGLFRMELSLLNNFLPLDRDVDYAGLIVKI
jgi:hypothetical protein